MASNTINTKDVAIAFSKLLKIRTTKNVRFCVINNKMNLNSIEFAYKTAPENTQCQFAEALENAIYQLIEEKDYIILAFEYEKIGNINNCTSDALTHVLQKLPKLGCDEDYSFLSKTSVDIAVVKRNKDNCYTSFILSNNIREKLYS